VNLYSYGMLLIFVLLILAAARFFWFGELFCALICLLFAQCSLCDAVNNKRKTTIDLSNNSGVIINAPEPKK